LATSWRCVAVDGRAGSHLLVVAICPMSMLAMTLGM
jgi:hypothetical protein